jgi:TPR repeat protein
LPSFKSHAFWKNLSALKSSCLTSLPVTYLNPQDDFKALKFFQKACGLNDGSGCSNLGLSYEKGKGVMPLPYKYPRIEQPLPEFKPHAFW